MHRVLFGNDSASMRALVCDILCSAGYSVIQADDGAQGLSLAQAYQGNIDVLVADSVIRRMSGFSWGRALADCHSEIPVLFLLNSPGRMVPRVRFLVKPFTPAELRAKVTGSNIHPITSAHD